MMDLPRFHLGTGRTSFQRGLIALFLAPALAALPAAALLYLDGNGGPLLWSDLPETPHFLYGLGSMIFRLTLLIGGPTWLLLRLLRWESGWLYAVIGLLEALILATGFSYGFNGHFRSDQVMTFAMLGMIGAITAFLFWTIARDPTAAHSEPVR